MEGSAGGDEMKEWCLEHPYLAFSAFIWTVSSIAAVLTRNKDEKKVSSVKSVDTKPEIDLDVN